MKNYSIVKVGNDYVVQAEEKSVLKMASRRMAAKLVAEASELLDPTTVQRTSPEADAAASIARDRWEDS
jgi:hypothetical protein